MSATLRINIIIMGVTFHGRHMGMGAMGATFTIAPLLPFIGATFTLVALVVRGTLVVAQTG